jgi:hypothetical protein
MAKPAAAVWRPVVTEIVRERIGAGEPVWLPVRGRSMRPLLSDGTRVMVTRARRVRAGDLLVYECEGAIVCHRVLDRRRGVLLTRADHGGGQAERVMPAQIVGVVIALDRAGRVIDVTTRGWRARALLIATRSLAGAAWARVRRRWWLVG